MATRLDELDRERGQAEKLAERIQADYADARTTMETSGRTEGLGQVLVAHRHSLPDARIYVDKAEARKQEIGTIGVRRLSHREELRRIGDIDQTFAEFEAQLADKAPQLRRQLRGLVEWRQTLLKKALEDDEFYLARLRELDAAEHKLLAAVRAYDGFLSEQLLWLASVEPTRLEDFRKLPGEAAILLSPAIWSGLARALVDRIAHSPAAWLALLSIAALFWKRRALIAAIEETSERVGKPTTDRFSHTLRALALTLVTAAPLSLLLATLGWQLQTIAQSTDLYHDVGLTLIRASMHLYVLRALRMMCIPRGLAAAHFRWRESSLQLLRAELDRLTWIFVPTVLILRLAIDLNPMETGGMIARLGILVALAALALFFYRVLHLKRGALAHWRLSEKQGAFVGTYMLWYAALVALPLGLAALPLLGYVYSLFTLSFMYVYTLWMIVALVLAHALALRWLLLVRRRLTYEAAMERREVEQAGDESVDGLQTEESEVDLEALSDDSRELLNVATIAGGLVLLYLIWSPLLPALRIFDDINLWYQTVTVDGEDQRLPITLADLGLALLYTIGIGILAKRLPALLEIILLRRFDVSAGSRYAVVTLANYAIIVIGVLLVVNTIGAQWSQLQWLVAALGVGIGFGLQEIVANFISGLIILFERPIRVGDMVTVGDTDGLVTKIRIRATTIRNFDRKELLVPNKEFITGRLLNWSLSDQVTRLVVVVGVAYGSDVDKAHALMQEAAEENEQVLDDPNPVVSFEGFGDNSLTLLLRVFIDDLDNRIQITTALHKAINRKFTEAGITIAFPQRDLHLDTNGPLRVSIEESRRDEPIDRGQFVSVPGIDDDLRAVVFPRTAAGDDLVNAISVHVAARDVYAPLIVFEGEDVDPVYRRQSIVVIVPSADMGAEVGARSGTGDDLGKAVAIDVARGHVDPVFVGPVSQETHSAHARGRTPIHVPAADMGTVHRAGTGAADDFIHSIAVQVAGANIDPPFGCAVSKEADTGVRRHRGPIVCESPHMRAEHRSWTGAGDNLLPAVAIKISAGNIDPVFVGAISHEIEPGQLAAVGLEGPDLGAEHRSGPGAGEDLVELIAVQIGRGHVDPKAVNPIGLDHEYGFRDTGWIVGVDIGHIVEPGSGTGDHQLSDHGARLTDPLNGALHNRVDPLDHVLRLEPDPLVHRKTHVVQILTGGIPQIRIGTGVAGIKVGVAGQVEGRRAVKCGTGRFAKGAGHGVEGHPQGHLVSRTEGAGSEEDSDRFVEERPGITLDVVTAGITGRGHGQMVVGVGTISKIDGEHGLIEQQTQPVVAQMHVPAPVGPEIDDQAIKVEILHHDPAGLLEGRLHVAVPGQDIDVADSFIAPLQYPPGGPIGTGGERDPHIELLQAEHGHVHPRVHHQAGGQVLNLSRAVLVNVDGGEEMPVHAHGFPPVMLIRRI